MLSCTKNLNRPICSSPTLTSRNGVGAIMWMTVMIGSSATALGQGTAPPLDQFAAPLGGSTNDLFGQSIAINSVFGAIGAPGWVGLVGGVEQPAQGAVNIYENFGDGHFEWQRTLTSNTGVSNDNCGMAVAASTNWVVAGVPGREVMASGASTVQLQAGAVWAWNRSGATWSAVPFEMTHANPKHIDLFGSSVAINEQTVDGVVRVTMAVGAPTDDDASRIDCGSVTLFEWDPVTRAWLRSGYIAPPTIGSENPAYAAYGIFGTAVALEGDYLFVGAKRQTVTTSKQGTVFVFRRDTPANPAATCAQTNPNWGEWCLVQRLVAPTPLAEEQFGASLGARNWGLVVGAPGAATSPGSVSIFDHVAATGTFGFNDQLFATGGQVGDRFGAAVAVTPDVAIIGAPGVDVGPIPVVADVGVVYLFGRDELACNDWTQNAKYIPPTASIVPQSNFGTCVETDSGIIAIAAPHAPNQVLGQGIVYTYLLDTVGCPPDIDGSGDIGGDDLALVFFYWGASSGAGLIADINGDLYVDSIDMLYILAHWGPCICGGVP